MTDSKVIIVMLRQPDCSDPNEMRTDPLWEFGSFGCTRCHTRNLMNPSKIDRLNSVRLAFAQGGDGQIRLVHVTPPIRTEHHGSFAEAIWRPIDMPLKFHCAPVLVNNDGYSDTPLILEMIENVNQPTPVSRFSSKFKTRCRPLTQSVGEQIVSVFENRRADGAKVAECYSEAMPYPPPLIDSDRRGTYEWFLSPDYSEDGMPLRKSNSSSCAPKQRPCGGNRRAC